MLKLLVKDGNPTCDDEFSETCSVLGNLLREPLWSLRVRHGQVKLSLVKSGTYIRPHAGPSGLKLRM